MAAMDAFAILRKQKPESKLLLFGVGCGIHEEVEQYAKARNIEQGIEFAGHQPYDIVMRRLSKESDILLHPANEESFRMTFIEAIAHGVPVIGGFNSGAVTWVLDHG